MTKPRTIFWVRRDIMSKEMARQVAQVERFIKKRGVELTLCSLNCKEAIEKLIRPSLTQLTIIIVRSIDAEFMAHRIFFQGKT